MTQRPRLVVPLFVPAVISTAMLAACGAKTGLSVPDAARPPPRFDAFVPRDAGWDGGVDAGCPPIPLRFQRAEVAALLLFDGSGSMGDTWEGLPPGPGLRSRWAIVHDALARVLPPFDRQLMLGAKVFPESGETCAMTGGLDVIPATGTTDEILAVFDAWTPDGGTPTAEAIRVAVAALDPDDERPTVVVVVLDGGPNCNADTGVPPHLCVCTAERFECLRPAPVGPGVCLDDVRTLEVVREAVEVRRIPVLVVGVDDPMRPDLSDFLDEMAVAGGMARPASAGRRFYNAREPEDLDTVFTDVTEIIMQCVLTGTLVPDPESEVEISLGDEVLPRDPTHEEGWDWTDPERGVITLFGSACERLRIENPPVTGSLSCSP